MENYIPNRRLIASKTIFLSAILLFAVVIIMVWISGLRIHRSIYENALLATTIISITCFLFFTIALYNGFKLKDTLGDFRSKFKWGKLSEIPDFGFGGGNGGGHAHGFFEGLLETLGAIILGIVAISFLIFLLWLFGNLIWAFILFISAALYWIFFRAVRSVLRHGPKCKNNFLKSCGYGLGYTALYSFTFYLLILIPYFFTVFNFG